MKKLGFAPNNESYVMNVLRFLNLIEEDDKRSDNGAAIFSHHDDGAFADAFGAQIRDSYSGLFELHGEQSWNLDRDALISFFRTSDQTTEIVGKRQATTFQLLAKFAGHGGPTQTTTRESHPKKSTEPKKSKNGVVQPAAKPNNPVVTPPSKPPATAPSRVGLTVRIEINFPADGDQDTYDRIFRSIRENFLG